MTRLIAGSALVLALASCSDGQAAVDRREFKARGLLWPFTVDGGRLGCDPGDFLWFEFDGQRWALHGRARSRYPYADPILRVDERLVRQLRSAGDTNPYEPRVSVQDAMEEARKLCPG